jgi:DNA-binding transcriptional LysR family regulator
MQDLNDMVLFARVVEHGSYSAAARTLGLPVSKLSRRLSELEKRLEVRLLQRTTRKLSVTDIGQSYYQHCAALIAEATAAQETIDRTRSAPQGVLRVSCPVPLIRASVGAIVARFMRENPRVIVHLEATGRRVDVIQEGFDIALRVRTPPLEASGLIVRQLGESATMLVASPSLLDRLGRPTHPSGLTRVPTLSMGATTGTFTWDFRDREGTALAITHTPVLMTDDFEAQRLAALEGVGIAYLPQFIVEADVAAHKLEHVLPEFSLPSGLYHAVFPSRRGMVPAVRAFLDALVSDCRTPAA